MTIGSDTGLELSAAGGPHELGAEAARALVGRRVLDGARALLDDNSGRLGVAILLALFFTAVAAPFLVHAGPLDVSPDRLAGPSLAHPLGTDELGRDVLSRLVYGSRISLGMALLVAVMVMTVSIVVGAVAGSAGGLVDAALMRAVDVILAFPVLILALAITGLMRPGLIPVLLALVSVWWAGYARIIRGMVQTIREEEFVDGARSLGAGPLRIVLRHILPHLLPPVIVLLSLDMGGIILAVSAFSYLGLGAQPPAPEWGAMLNQARVYFLPDPWLIIVPGAAITIAVLGFNLVGDALRDSLDPRLRAMQPRLGRTTRDRIKVPPDHDARLAASLVAGPMLEVRGLSVEFLTARGRLRAVEDVSYALDRGEILAIVGETGSGKTVAAQAVVGLLDGPEVRVTGSARYLGTDLLTLPETRRRAIRGREIAMVFQDPLAALNPVLSIGSQVSEMFTQHLKLSRKEAWERTGDVLDRVRLPAVQDVRRAYPHELSGGMRQRVVIGMALALGPRLLIADEPTTGLDVSIQAQIMELLVELRAETGTSLVLITHNLGLVAEFADRVMVMYAGRSVETARTTDFFAHAAHPYSRGLLSAVPRVDRREAHLTPIPGAPPDAVSKPQGCLFHPRCSWCRPVCTLDSPSLQTVAAAHASACHFARDVMDDAADS